jgi:hypothetical protein
VRLSFVEAVFAICVAPVFAQHAAASTYVTFDVPGSCSAGVPYGINKWGSVTGFYTTCSSEPQGFLYQPNGVITTFTASVWGTNPMSINDTGWIVGYYNDKFGAHHGFLRTPKYTTLDVPGAGTNSGQGTEALSINNSGEISGVYFDANSVEHGFVRDASGNYTSFDVSGGSAVTSAGLNQTGQIAGNYTTAGNVSHGYVREADGTITAFDAPGSSGTYVIGINSTENTTGYFFPDAGGTEEFTRDQYGNVTTFNISGYLSSAGIQDNGNVIGSYKNGSKYHGWKRTAAGAVSYFSDPSATGRGTFPTCVSGNDLVAGIYYDSSGNQHSFVMHN